MKRRLIVTYKSGLIESRTFSTPEKAQQAKRLLMRCFFASEIASIRVTF